MNKDLARFSAVWRALFRVRGPPLLLLIVYLLPTCQRAEDGFAADDGSVSGDGRSFRCCTVGELLRDCDSVSVIVVQEKCDEKRRVVRLGKSNARDGRGIPPLWLPPRLRSGLRQNRAGSFRKVRGKGLGARHWVGHPEPCKSMEGLDGGLIIHRPENSLGSRS